jgi:hypothetical protein
VVGPGYLQGPSILLHNEYLVSFQGGKAAPLTFLPVRDGSEAVLSIQLISHRGKVTTFVGSHKHLADFKKSGTSDAEIREALGQRSLNHIKPGRMKIPKQRC